MPCPARIGRFEIVALLGTGGMGEVYRARDRDLGRDVAIKVLPVATSSETNRVSRFVRETRAAGQLNHPNILAIYDVGTDEGAPYLVSELLEGETLRDRLKSGPLSPRKAVEYGAQIARGLAAAHEHGIVHRDLKPENVFITTDGRVKILDFGLAKLAEAGEEESQGYSSEALATTESGMAVGTIGYMSPEQLRGNRVDTRADLFALGAVLYEMLSGKRAFPGGSAAETTSAILRDDPPALRLRHPSIPSVLDRILRHCLEKKPEERFQSARDLAFALDAIPWQPERSAFSRLFSRLPRFGAHLARAPLFFAGVLLLLISAAVAILLSRGGQIRSMAVLPFGNASQGPEAESLSDGITESLIRRLSELPNLRVPARSTVFQYKEQKADARTIGSRLKVGAVLTGQIVQRRDDLIISAELVDVRTGAQLWGEQYNRKLADIFSIQEEISREIVSRLKLRITRDQTTRIAKRDTQDPEAYQLYLRGRYQWNKRSPEGLKKSVEYFQQAIEKDPTYAQAYDGLADAYVALGALGVLPPRETYPRARVAAKEAIKIDDALAEAHASLADVYTYYDWDWPAAETEYRRATALNPNYSTAHQWYANFLLTQKRFPEALAETKRALELDPLSLVMNQNLAWVVYHCRRYNEAIEQLQKTLEMEPNFAPSRGTLAMVYEARGLYPMAFAELQKWLLLQGMSPDDVAQLGKAYAEHDRVDFLRLLVETMRERAKGTYFPAFDFARLYSKLEDKDQAFLWLEKAYEERSSSMPYLAVDPILDGLRSDPRLLALLARMRLPTKG